MKYLKLIALLLTAVFLFAACDTSAPATDTPEAVVEPTVAEEPTEMATEEMMEPTPTEEMMAEPTEEPTAEPTEEPTAEPTEEPTAEPMMEVSEVGLELVADGFTSPVDLEPAPDGSGKLFVVDRVGQIWIVTAEGEILDEPFIDIQDKLVEFRDNFDERGLLGLAFHPDYENNGRFFLYYSAPLRDSAPTDWNHTSHVSEFTVSADNPDMADPNSERILLEVDEPEFNHDAGTIAFGPDGYLYIPLGDGGAADDNALGHVEDWYETNAGGNGQDLTSNLLGSILRIDVDNEGQDGQPYAIPMDNPFVDIEGAEEIFAFGFRNPYRMSFDMGGNNALYVGDAGQNLWEEVSIVEAGGNYGWNVYEGTHCFSTENPDQSLEDCPEMDNEGRPLIDPVIEYQNANAEGGLGLVVIGGSVYRGSNVPAWDGLYFFGDWSTSFSEPDGKLFVADPMAMNESLWTFQELTITNTDNGRLNEFLLSFGQDSNGEIYILTSESTGPSGETGKVYQLVSPEM